MPTPRKHGGSAIQNIPLTVPGFKGLNKEAASSVLGPEWATELLNSVLDENNRVASRKGWVTQTTTALPAGAQFNQIKEYRTKADVRHIIGVADDSKLYKSTDDGQTFSDVTNTATVSDANMQLINFNDVLIGCQDGASPVVYDGTNFTNLTDGGSEPQGGIGVSAYGRVWIVDSDGITVKYSGLLDHTDWSSSSAGQISLENVWPESDTITALAAFNGALAIFGRENVVIYTDGAGSAIGLDPLQAYVVDTIGGVGCIARDSVQNIKGDLWFLSRDGLQSLGRLVQEKSNPLDNLSKNIQDFLVEAITDSNLDLTDVRSVYSPEDRFYLLSLSRTRTDGSGNTSENGRAFIFDTRGKLDDGSARCMGQWTGLVPRAVTKRRNNDLLIALTDIPGELGLYQGYQDNDTGYIFTYESGWIDITGTQGYMIIPKRIDAVYLLGSDNSVSIKWAFDFAANFTTRTTTFEGIGSFAEWGVSEWGEAEWGGGTALKKARVAGSGTGEYIKIGTTATINGGLVAVQQLNIFAKIGRYA